jgi:hypothetical protein
MAVAWIGAADASVVISGAPTRNMNCAAGVCSPTAKNSVLNASDLAAMLGTSDVKVTTGSGAVMIAVTAPLSWGSSNRLTLDAQQTVSIRAAVIAEGTSGVTITLDEGAAGSLDFYPGGSITFWDTASGLVIDGDAYTLVNDIATLASDIASNPAGFYALARDYDASVDGTYHASPIQTRFGGTLEGLGHAISNLTIAPDNSVRYVGLFAQTYPRPTIRDIGLENVQVSASSYNYDVGALVGEFAHPPSGSGGIFNVYVHGSITGGFNTGGLVGWMTHNSIRRSHCDCTVSSSGSVGGIVGYNYGLSLIANSYTSGTVGGLNAVAGGILGSEYFNESVPGTAIINSYSTANVGSNSVGNKGGLVGQLTGTITSSHASGTVEAGYDYAGGLVGGNLGTITDSYATGAVTGSGHGAGGLAGYNAGSIQRSFATGSVTGGEYAGVVGGLAGATAGPIQSSYATGAVLSGAPNTVVGGLVGLVVNAGSVTNAYAMGSVGGGDPTAIVGGLVGRLYGNYGGGISAAYSTGAVSGPKKYTGGSIGKFEDGTIASDYWDIFTSGTKRSAGGVGLRTDELRSGLPAGFDPAIWGEDKHINDGYPYLLALPPK